MGTASPLGNAAGRGEPGRERGLHGAEPARCGDRGADGVAGQEHHRRERDRDVGADRAHARVQAHGVARGEQQVAAHSLGELGRGLRSASISDGSPWSAKPRHSRRNRSRTGRTSSSRATRASTRPAIANAADEGASPDATACPVSRPSRSSSGTVTSTAAIWPAATLAAAAASAEPGLGQQADVQPPRCRRWTERPA